MKPIIGITLDYVTEGSFSSRPHYALREHYFNAVAAAGGIPFGIAYNTNLIDDYLNRVDGLVIPGGDFGLDPEWYIDGEKPAFAASPRLQFDIEIIKRALERKIPLLGICAGMQILGGMHGCKMTNNVMKYFHAEFDHLRGKPAEEYAHKIKVTHNTLLERIVGSEMDANSRHREGIVFAPDSVTISGISPDGVVKAIELPEYEFALGVQWHPEFFIEKAEGKVNKNLAIFENLVKRAVR